MSQQFFTMTILGRTVQHLGTQMYKHRAPSIAELVANCWDAGADWTRILVPEPQDYDPASSEVVLMDCGEGGDAFWDDIVIDDGDLISGLFAEAEILGSATHVGEYSDGSGSATVSFTVVKCLVY